MSEKGDRYNTTLDNMRMSIRPRSTSLYKMISGRVLTWENPVFACYNELGPYSTLIFHFFLSSQHVGFRRPVTCYIIGAIEYLFDRALVIQEAEAALFRNIKENLW